jgi:hypothetical protein
MHCDQGGGLVAQNSAEYDYSNSGFMLSLLLIASLIR